MRFHKYHALGNDYLVLNPADFPGWTAPTREQIRAICHRNFGVGSDGILWGPLRATQAQFGLRIFNPAGSEAEKSGVENAQAELSLGRPEPAPHRNSTH